MIKTKFIITLGPASESKEIARELGIGTDFFRINTAYGSEDEIRDYLFLVCNELDSSVIFDLKGPEIRIYGTGSKSLFVGSVFEVEFGSGDNFYFNHDLSNMLSVGDKVLIDNGSIETVVEEKTHNSVFLKSLNEGQVYSGKGVNLPEKRIKTPTLSSRDIDLIDIAIDFDVEYIALSFTRNKEDVETLRKKVKDNEIGIIAKIESEEGIKNIDRVLEVAEGVMVARGDLGIEISLEKVPLIQKELIYKCNKAGVPAITATEVFESMIKNPVPTRAEVSDAANAVLDGTDALMLSGETAIGKHPIKSLNMLKSVASEVEPKLQTDLLDKNPQKIPESISKAVISLSRNMDIDKIVALTKTGFTSRMISRFKPNQQIIAVTPNKKVCFQQNIVYGVKPIKIDFSNKKNKFLFVAKKLLEGDWLDKKDKVVFASTKKEKLDKIGENLIQIHKMDELDL